MGRWVQWVTRTLSGDSRAQMLQHLEFLLRDVEQFVDSGRHEDICTRVEAAVIGLQGLQRTYATDVSTACTLAFAAERLAKVTTAM
jgi:hypothetical protein